MNPVLILTRNNLELTKRCVESVRAQDVRCEPFIIDNGSTDGTLEWAIDEFILLDAADRNVGVTAQWNFGFKQFFSDLQDLGHVFCCGNDTVVPPWFCRELLSYDVPFVTGVAVDNMDAIKEPPQRMPLQPNPDYSAYLIRREAWEKIGPFDERMVSYCSDCDHHVRGHRLGVGMWKANIPYFHQSSSTMRLAPYAERSAIQAQADADREVFKGLYGCLPGTVAYEALFK